MDVDLARAVGAKLGVRVRFTQVQFRDILAGVQQDEYDIGVSSITDTTRREELGDFVTYFQAGSSLLVRSGNPLTLYPDDESLCGHRVAAQDGTVEVDPVAVLPVGEVRRRRPAPDHPGRGGRRGRRPHRPAQRPRGRDGRGRTDRLVRDGAFRRSSADRRRPDRQGSYGFALAKEDKPMDDAILRAMQDLIDDGEYATILSHWGLTAGRVQAATLDGAIN